MICVRNDGYPVSLEVRKVYERIPDMQAEAGGQIRVVDESGEDYLFPKEYFTPVELSAEAQAALD